MAQSHQFQPVVTTNLTATLTDGNTESDAIDLSGTTLTALEIPASFEGAALTLQAASSEAGTYYEVCNSNGTPVTITAAASRIITLDPAQMAGLRYIKLVADTAQTGDVSLTLMTRPVS